MAQVLARRGRLKVDFPLSDLCRTVRLALLRVLVQIVRFVHIYSVVTVSRPCGPGAALVRGPLDVALLWPFESVIVPASHDWRQGMASGQPYLRVGYGFGSPFLARGYGLWRPSLHDVSDV